MSNNPKVSARPPLKKEVTSDKLENMAASFIKEGTYIKTDSSSEQTVKVFPWEGARDDVYKTFNLRLPEEYAMKLDYVAMKYKKSKHAVCMSVVKAEIDRLLKEVDA